MVKLNNYIVNMDTENTFLKVKGRVNEYKLNNPKANIISLEIGDVSLQ